MNRMARAFLASGVLVVCISFLGCKKTSVTVTPRQQHSACIVASCMFGGGETTTQLPVRHHTDKFTKKLHSKEKDDPIVEYSVQYSLLRNDGHSDVFTIEWSYSDSPGGSFGCSELVFDGSNSQVINASDRFTISIKKYPNMIAG